MDGHAESKRSNSRDRHPEAPVTINGRESLYRVTSFEHTLTVTVTGADVLDDSLKWAKDYWAIFAAIGAGLGTLWAWLLRRRPRRAGFDSR